MTRSSLPSLPSDVALLIDRARGGCTQATGELLEACRGYLLAVANTQLDPDLRRKLGGSDLVQESFVHAHRDMVRFRGNTERELLGWLRRILLNQIALAQRTYRETEKRDIAREQPLQRDGSTCHGEELAVCPRETPSRQVAHAEELLRIDAAIARLPAQYALVIELRSRKLKNFDEIGTTLELGADAARKLWVRAIVRLQRDLNGTAQ